jgi:D-erythronate 2-dehydrogenase
MRAILAAGRAHGNVAAEVRMHITILGGGGFLGQKLAQHIAREATARSLTLFDIAPPRAPAAPFPLRALAGDITDAAALAQAIPPETTHVVHLAAVVSAAAEADLDLGLRVNLHGSLAVLEACRKLPAPPRLVFTSSVAAFSGGQGAMLGDEARQLPANSYGAQKAMAELLFQDAARRGLLDAVNLRLPTISVRPGRPNKAASSFISAILREPLLGLPTNCPVEDDFAVWIASPRSAVAWLWHATTMDTAPLGLDRAINPPGLSARIGDMLACLAAQAPEAAHLVTREPDPAIAAIVGGWPAAFSAERARRLGFAQQPSLAELLDEFITEDLAATRAERGLAPEIATP